MQASNEHPTLVYIPYMWLWPNLMRFKWRNFYDRANAGSDLTQNMVCGCVRIYRLVSHEPTWV